MGGNGFGHSTRQIGDSRVADTRVLEVTDVESEHLSHAREQCIPEAE